MSYLPFCNEINAECKGLLCVSFWVPGNVCIELLLKKEKLGILSKADRKAIADYRKQQQNDTSARRP